MIPTNTPIQNLLVIDSSVNDSQSLAAGVGTDTAVLILDSKSDGLTQISAYLSNSAYPPLQSIQIISHGSAGSLQLGSSLITTSTLNFYTKQLAAIGSNLTATGDILLYGCDVATGQSGLDFINLFSTLTSADVAASNDVTGSAVLGGNWVLEASTGVIEVEMALYSPKLDNYNGILTVADITSLSFNSGFSQDGLTPLLSFSVELSSNFSNTNSIQLLYWAVNNEQTWITLTRNSVNQPFTATIELPFYAKSGAYEIRAFQVTDNTGTFVAVSQQQLIDRGFNVHADLVNPLSDDQAPSLDSVSVGSSIVASDGIIHVAVEINTSDSSSGLNQKFLLEIASPSGASLQQWATFDANGHAIVDFSLSPYSASGDYHINTIRLTDLAGNYNDSRSWLNANSTPIIITNPNQDIIAPEIKNFALEAVFDPITDRPKIVISGVVTDDISGVKGVYLRMNSPAGSSAFLDTWVYADYYSQPGTNQKTVQLDSYKALTTDFLPGEYSVNFLRVGDAANNEVYLYSQIIQETVRVYFPDPLHNLGETSVNASDQGDFVFGSDKLDDHLFANGGDDIIYSGLGDDYLFGGTGADILYAGSGNDVVNAGAGNDLIVGGDGEGNDTYAGGDGFDTIKYTSAVADITVNLLNGTAFATAGGDAAHIGVDSLSGIEGIISGNYNDTLIGNDVNNDINGDTGNDIITGGGGNDNINGGDGSDTAVFSGTYTNYTKSFNSIINQYTLIANSGNDGTDIVSNVEFFRFSDRTVAASSLVNTAPTFTTFASTVASGNEDNQIAISFANLQTQGNEADVDGTVSAFVIKAVSSGTLLIGTNAATATAWNALTNNTVDATHQAYWTPVANSNGTLNVFTAVAKDNGGLESVTAIQVTVAVTPVNDTPTGTVSITGTATQGQQLTAAKTLADVDGMDTVTYTWYVSGSSVSIGTGSTYTLSQAQVGKTLTVVASYTDLQGKAESVTSSATSLVSAPINQSLNGTANIDILTGSAGNDTIIGLDAVDKLDGKDGSDLYIITATADHTAAEITDTGLYGSDEVRFTSVTASTLTLYLGDTGIETVVIGTGTAATAVSTATTALACRTQTSYI